MTALIILVVLFALAAAGATVWAMVERGRLREAELRLQLLSDQDQALKGQAALTAQSVADQLVKRAAETFEQQERQAQARLEAQLKPVAETLEKFQAQVTEAEKARAEQAGGLKAQIEQMLAASQATQEEARRLSGALRRGAGVQGRWGEQMLRNTLELAGMQAGIDFEEQWRSESEDGIIRPDVIVRLPGGMFIIDAKCSLTAYQEALDAETEEARAAALTRHAQSLQQHLRSLSQKAYWDKLENTPDFVVMFVPGDGLLAAAAERVPDLYVGAMDKSVVLTTPSSLFALCKAVLYGFRIEKQSENARQIAETGRELYKRLSVMGGHVHQLGTGLTRAVEGYNRFVGSLETQVLTQAKRFEDFAVERAATPIAELPALEASVRPLSKLALTPPEGDPTCAE